MTDDDLRLEATVEAASLHDQILAAVDLPDRAVAPDVLARALANALVAVVQEYLGRTSERDDVELFFEVHGRAPDDLASWAPNILADLHRHHIPLEDRRHIRERAALTAATYIESSSPLAWE